MTNEYIFPGKTLKSELLYEYTIHRNKGESLKDWLGTDYNAYLAIDDKKEYKTDAQLTKCYGLIIEMWLIARLWKFYLGIISCL